MATNTIKVYFKWISLQPDKRQWKPSNPLLEPFDVGIAVEVPLKHEYIANSEFIISQQLANETNERPILTPKGMRYCIDQFENEMSDKQPDKQTEDDNTEWEEIVDNQKNEWK